MGFTSLQALMDPSDWLQGTMSDDGGIDSSSPSSMEMLACSRPLMERRLRPPHDQALNCPRCDSTNTKFCYYNNYSLTQPRYFCKTCRRYWTKGGTLRNIPVGGGCRKTKKSSSSSSSSSKKPISVDQHSSSETGAGHIQLSFPQVQLSNHFNGLIGGHNGGLGTSFLDNKYNALLDRAPNLDYLEAKFDALGSHNAARGHGLLGSSNIGVDFGLGSDHHFGFATPNNLFPNTLSSSSSPFSFPTEGSSSSHGLDTACQRLMLPYDYHQASSNDFGRQTQSGLIDVKPSTKHLSLEWQGNNGGAMENKDNFGYNNNNNNNGVNGLSSWSGSMLNGYSPSTTNSLL
ncbi:hypothetical protein V2J09_011985 [Rumex salicifolius]